MSDEPQIDYLECFRTLGLSPHESEWRRVRLTYRALIRRWHPDRFPPNSHEQAIAEEQTKLLNLAYQALAAYQRQHGQLPTNHQSVPPPSANPDSQVENSGNMNSIQLSQRTVTRDIPERAQRHGTKRWIPWGIGAFAIVYTSLYLVKPIHIEGGNHPTPLVSDNHRYQPEANRQVRYFTIGSTVSELYASQGIPSIATSKVWHYGKSKVFLDNNRVTSWEEHEENPLHATLVPTYRSY